MIGLLAALGCAAPVGALPHGADSEACGACHSGLHAEWAGSAHARSAESPVFLALLPEIEAAWGELARQRCEGCHAPVDAPEAAIGCVMCHAAVGNHAERDGALAIDLEAPLAGPLGAAAAETTAHRSVQRGFLTESAACGTCHEVSGPELFVEHTFGEFQASPAAASGETCLDCHAPAVEDRPSTDGTPARPSRDHRFVGVDPPWGADDAEAAAAAEATLALYRTALDLRIERAGGAREVVVTNVGAGHAVPTGVAFLRDVWVEVEVDGVTRAEPVLRLGAQPERDGVAVVLPTDADSVRSMSLDPGESARAALPDGAAVVRLRARAIKPAVLTEIGLGELASDQPIHEIATAED